jgi:hypothetical protein
MVVDRDAPPVAGEYLEERVLAVTHCETADVGGRIETKKKTKNERKKKASVV